MVNRGAQETASPAGRLLPLHTALISDVLDGLGHRVGAMESSIRGVAGPARLAGRAFTFSSVPIDEPEPVPYERLLAGFRHMTAGSVVVLATNGERRSGMWGELLATAALARGAVGAVTDGLTRDNEALEGMGFAVFANGTSPVDSAGRQAIEAFGEPVVCGNVEVHPGDVVFGDPMGVVVIPSALLEETLRLAEEKASGEDVVRVELARGDDPAEVFARHGIL
jgi:4-hydroxy-4-methyl-2-oxoglutarate aldolase